MSEEEIAAAAKAAAENSEGDDLSQKIATLESEKSNLVNEIKEDRKARQALKDEVETLKTALTQSVEGNKNPEDDKVKSVVENVLASREASRATNNRKIALEKFVTENKEFHPDNDSTGIMREALERKLSSFNLSGLSEVDDFIKVIGEAKTLLVQKDTGTKSSIETEVKNPYSSTSQSTITPTVKDTTGLTAAEVKLIGQAGFTKEKYLELKSKMPSYINGLLKNV